MFHAVRPLKQLIYLDISLGLLGGGIGPLKGLYVHRAEKRWETVSSGIRTHDPSVQDVQYHRHFTRRLQTYICCGFEFSNRFWCVFNTITMSRNEVTSCFIRLSKPNHFEMIFRRFYLFHFLLHLSVSFLLSLSLPLFFGFNSEKKLPCRYPNTQRCKKANAAAQRRDTTRCNATRHDSTRLPSSRLVFSVRDTNQRGPRTKNSVSEAEINEI
jgi:hypothetical protein